MIKHCPYPHYKPIGFDVDEPRYGYHGESNHPNAVRWQCMCGHYPYYDCEYHCLYRQVFEIEEAP